MIISRTLCIDCEGPLNNSKPVPACVSPKGEIYKRCGRCV